MRLVLACLMLSLGCLGLAMPAGAADLSRGSRIVGQPYTVPATEEGTYKAHNWYGGLVGGYAWTPDEVDDSWHGGIVAGYLWRPSGTRIGAGVEVDYELRDLGDVAIDDGVGSVRGRAGVFVLPGTFVYATGGISRATELAAPEGFRKGPVVGGGVEQDIQGTNAAVRAELLHYRHSDDYTDWGDEGSTAARVGLVFKF